ncbi:MAG: 50S ribosomal protein L6 [Candidatus Marsarchaeota archaeon]|jgi:large subunit ribosomal protein L6|nr:50S ribosomal protein L6 [Candidatus Marsarchaeota archaeon]MCL5112069.1 50S ribosomal protein L6 [Candidatus Marsarchaeota archaeon]
MMTLKIPDGITANVDGDVISVKGSLGENRRKFNSSLLGVSVGQDGITIKATELKELRKKAEVSERSLAKEISNDMAGVAKYFEIRMQSLHAHFPLTSEVKDGVVLIKNIAGERSPRTAKIAGGTKVEIKGQDLRIYGTMLDDVTQTAANIRKACKIRHRDERVFQDGIYYAIEE